MNTIKLVCRADGWYAYHYGPVAAEVAKLFNGRTALPTAYTQYADPQEVLSSIKIKNPDCTVSLG